MKQIILRALIPAFIVVVAFIAIGCSASPPDTSAPQREEIERTADWQGALLYIADDSGPIEGWGSIRVYDNVSGFVEQTIEQTLAAAPSDMYVTTDESTMFVASLGNGRIDTFTWDGKTWNRSMQTIDSPAYSLLTLVPGPDGRLYAANGTPESPNVRLYAFDMDSGQLSTAAPGLSGVNTVHGIAWSLDGASAYISSDSDSSPVLVETVWPSGEPVATLTLPLGAVNQVVASPDGARLYVMGGGGIVIVDAASFSIIATINPSSMPGSVYVDADFSADGRFLFTAASEAGTDSTLYVIDLANNQTVNMVKHISGKANGIQRVE